MSVCKDILGIPAAGDKVKLWVQIWAGSDIRLSLGLKFKDIVRLLSYTFHHLQQHWLLAILTDR